MVPASFLVHTKQQDNGKNSESQSCINPCRGNRGFIYSPFQWKKRGISILLIDRIIKIHRIIPKIENSLRSERFFLPDTGSFFTFARGVHMPSGQIKGSTDPVARIHRI